MKQDISKVVEQLNRWYSQEWLIALLSVVFFISGILTGVGFVGLIIPVILILNKRKLKKQIQTHALRISDLDHLEKLIEEKDQLVVEMKREIAIKAELEVIDRIQRAEQLQVELDEAEAKLEASQVDLLKIEKQVATQKRKVDKFKLLYQGLEHALAQSVRLSATSEADLIELYPTVSLNIHSMDVKELRKEFKANEQAIQTVLKKYQSGYTTKTNRTLYDLMVLALSAELQNILYNLKYTNLDQSNALIYDLIKKYRALVVEGNQSIAPTLNRCISELEYFYLNAIQIEYKYYIAKEQQKNEQAALREQMKQEVEERKQLEAQRKLIEKEESKYLAEIQKAQEQLKLQAEHDELSQQLLDKITQLQAQLDEVEVQKEEVVKRQNGKAGYVYVISNLGAFGENVFKVGMTRRLDPMDRIKELGSASVPFLLDVHSFIFSDDAVGLEQQLHQALQERRVNKINHRKEFFQVSLNELETLVSEIDPTVEFNRTMVAEEYRQSLALTQAN